MKILVTGGGGFIGSWLVKCLLNDGHQITILDNLSNCTKSQISHLTEKGAIFAKGDITKINEIENLFAGHELVVHLAAQIDVNESIKNPDFNYTVNVKGTKNVLDACIKNNVKKIIAVSSSAVYGNVTVLPITETTLLQPISPYGQSKLDMEKLLQEYSKNYDLDSISLRLFNVYGLGQTDAYAGVITKFMKNIQENSPLVIFGDGTYSRDFIAIEDVVKGFQNAIANITGKKGNCYNIATGVSTSILDLAKTMIDISGKKLEIIFKDAKKGDIPHSKASISLAKNELNFSPNISLKNGLENFFQYS